MNYPRIELRESDGVVVYTLENQDAEELGMLLAEEGRRVADRGWEDDGDEIFRLAHDWRQAKAAATHGEWEDHGGEG